MDRGAAGEGEGVPMMDRYNEYMQDQHPQAYDLLEGPGVRSGLDAFDGDESLGYVELDLRVASEASRSWMCPW